MQYLRQSTASQSVLIGPFVDSTDGNTDETGLTIANTDIRLSKNGGNLAAKNSGGGTHDEIGYYTITLDATDTNTVGRLQLLVHVSGALPVYHEFQVLEEAVYDALFAASAPGYVANAPVNVAQFGGTNGTFSAGRPEVNTTHAAGTAWASGAITAASIASNAITAAKIAADAIGASELAADAASEIGTAVWATASRVLTAGTNITLAKGVGVTGFNDLSAAQVNTEVDTALGDYDAPTYDELEGFFQLLMRSDSAIATDRSTLLTAINANEGTGAGTYDNTTESEQALRDRGDAAWITATGFSTHSAADVRTEMDANSTRLAAIVADTNEMQGDLADDGRLDLIFDAILAMLDDPRTEPGQGAPPVNPDMATKIDYLYKNFRNKKTQDATSWSLFDDAGTTVDQKATVSDDGSTATKGEIATGP